jgi:hypothetical protein
MTPDDRRAVQDAVSAAEVEVERAARRLTAEEAAALLDAGVPVAGAEDARERLGVR